MPDEDKNFGGSLAFDLESNDVTWKRSILNFHFDSANMTAEVTSAFRLLGITSVNKIAISPQIGACFH